MLLWDLGYESWSQKNRSPWSLRQWKPHDPALISFDAVQTCDGQLERQTETPPIPMSRSSIAERNRNNTALLSFFSLSIFFVKLQSSRHKVS